MWHTPDGTRVLQDIERELARRGLETAYGLVELGVDTCEPWTFGVEQFDTLTPEQQLAMLAEVGRALFYKSVTAPAHTAVNEACIYAIYRALETLIELEIDGEDHYERSTRDLICEFVAAERAAAEYEDFTAEAPLLTPDSEDTEQWHFEVECLADRVLWDRDWELDQQMVDCSPERAQLLKMRLGIDDDYFVSIAPEPSDLSPVRRTLNKLIRSKPR